MNKALYLKYFIHSFVKKGKISIFRAVIAQYMQLNVIYSGSGVTGSLASEPNTVPTSRLVWEIKSAIYCSYCAVV